MDRKVKQVIVIRKDLKMRRGKEIAQGAHASMAFLTSRIHWDDFTGQFMTLGSDFSPAERQWIEGSFRKVTLQVDSEQALLDVYQAAKDAGLAAHLITDAGLTEFGGQATDTAVAIGPDWDDLIDPVTEKLELY